MSTADLGGTPGWDAVAPPRSDEPVFAHPWEGRAFALALVAMGRISGRNVDAFRHALARLSRADYLDDGYYGRWLNAAELMLVDSAILARGAVDARARVRRGERVDEPSAPARHARPDYRATAPGSLRPVPDSPRFAVGDRVRVRDALPGGHTQLPGYLRGRGGVVAIVQPSAVLPDTHAHFAGENPQHVYAVGFASRELWGPGGEDFTLTADLYDSYLEPAP